MSSTILDILMALDEIVVEPDPGQTSNEEELQTQIQLLERRKVELQLQLEESPRRMNWHPTTAFDLLSETPNAAESNTTSTGGESSHANNAQDWSTATAFDTLALNLSTEGNGGAPMSDSSKDLPVVPKGRRNKIPRPFDSIELEADPDDNYPVKGKIKYNVSRGYLFVSLPSKAGNKLERCVLVKGSEYKDDKQRFIEGNGRTIRSATPADLGKSTWTDFVVNNVATTTDQKMTLIEGYVAGNGRKDMKILSLSTLRQAYGTIPADCLVVARQLQVGQKMLEKMESRREDILSFLQK